MDGENSGKPYEQMDDLGGKNPYFWVDTHMWVGERWFLFKKKRSSDLYASSLQRLKNRFLKRFKLPS